MIRGMTAVYAILCAVLVNAALLFRHPVPIVLCALLLLAINLFCGLRISGSKSLRLRILCHGTVLLICFCTSVLVSLIVHLLALTGVIPCDKTWLITSLIFCIVFCAILFWNGILCVYLTSTQLGIALRIVGAVCGWIFGLNIVLLIIIISKTYREVLFERQKEIHNDARRDECVCKTTYPILLVHGVFFRDSKWLNYWGRIPGELEKNGATCFYGEHHSASSVKDSAEELAARIRQIVQQSGCEKVNIIAHSKGGLDCRYALAHCGIADLVASLTTINTPHRGCMFADWLLGKASVRLKDTVAATYNRAALTMGDTHPDFLAAVGDLTAQACCQLDEQLPLPEGVYCRSVGSVMKKAVSGRFPLNVSYFLVKHFDGRNDGLVGEHSFAWRDSSYTLLQTPSRRGISHADMIDLTRENIKDFDVREFYVSLVAELKQKGY